MEMQAQKQITMKKQTHIYPLYTSATCWKFLPLTVQISVHPPTFIVPKQTTNADI